MAHTLPAYYYTDASHFAAEMERWYFNRWICVGREQEIEKPGDYFLREIAAESIIVTRDSEGAVRAFYNVCRHRGTRMCTEARGSFRGKIVCPYHGWSYTLDGKLAGAPNCDVVHEDYPLHEIATDVWDGHVFVHMAQVPAGGSPARTLACQLGELPQKVAA